MFQTILGIAGFIFIAWVISENRRAFSWKLVLAGILSQLGLALLILKVPFFRLFFTLCNQAVDALQEASKAGSSFVFGFIGGGPLPYAETFPGASFSLAFQALPMVLLISALSALLYHWRILPWVVRIFSRALEKLLGIGGAVGICAAATAFLGMLEAPLLIRPYLSRLSRGEIFIVMTCGMSTIAGTMMALYASFLSGVIPDPAGHILTASLISIPAAIMVAKTMIPDNSKTGQFDLAPEKIYESSMDAVVRGTKDGIELLIGIIAMLVVLVGLVHLANQILGLFPGGFTLQKILGFFMAPIAWLMGIPWAEALKAGEILGVKIVLNELLAYLELAKLPPEALSEKSRIIMTYALCGFANFGSLGILIGGLGAMAPERRSEIVNLGLRAIVSGTIASCMTASVVNLIL